MNRSRRQWLLVVIGTLLWVLAIYPAYYVVHKPVEGAQLRALANAAADLLTWLAMLAVATALGLRLTRRLVYHSPLERLAFSAGLGLGAFSLLTFGLGLLGLLYGWLFWTLLIGGGVLLWREFRDLVRAFRQVVWSRPRSPWLLFLSFFVVATLVLALITALLPPTEWDSLVYHLVGPERYLQAHRLIYDFHNYYLFFPSFTEMLFTAGMALKGDVVPRLIHLGYLLLTLGALGAFAARYWERRLGLLAIALFLSIPTAVQIATWSYVDLALTFYNLAALYALLNWLDDMDSEASLQSGWLILAGLFGGASASIKYTGVVSLLVLAVVLIYAVIRYGLGGRRFLMALLIVGGLSLLVAAPWYVKNAIVAGNPFYPLVWGGREWNEISTRWMLVPGERMSISDLLVVPWTMTVVGKQGTVAYDATISPLFLMLLPLLLVVRRQTKYLGALLLAAMTGYVFWIASGVAAYGTFILRGRQALPIFAPLSLLCAWSLEGLCTWDQKSFSLRRVIIMLTGLTLAVNLLGQGLLTAGLNPWPYLTGYQSRDDYLAQHTSQHLHQAISYLNQHLGGSEPVLSRVLFIWEPRSYGCRVPHQADVLFDNFAQRLARDGSPEGVLAGLRRDGFTHLLVNEYIYTWIVKDFPIAAEERAGWESFAARYLTDETLVHAEGDYLFLYRLPRVTGP